MTANTRRSPAHAGLRASKPLPVYAESPPSFEVDLEVYTDESLACQMDEFTHELNVSYLNDLAKHIAEEDGLGIGVTDDQLAAFQVRFQDECIQHLRNAQFFNAEARVRVGRGCPSIFIVLFDPKRYLDRFDPASTGQPTDTALAKLPMGSFADDPSPVPLTVQFTHSM